MKTLKLSSIAFAFLCIFSSCSKDSSELTSSSSSSSTSLNSTEALYGSGQGKGGGAVNEGIGRPEKVVPEMTISFNPDPAVKGEDVTVTGTFSVEQGIVPCGKLQLHMSSDGGVTWGMIGQEKEISAADQQVTYTFQPTSTEADKYQFKLHYIAAGCEGYEQGWSGIFLLDVVEPCSGFTFEGSLIGDPVPAGGGLYEFTVQYVVNTCGVEFDKLKIQGGLTNATNIVEATPQDNGNVDYQNWIPGGSKNWINRWIETAPSGLLHTNERVYTVRFTKAYAGSGPVELTGGWSVTLTKAGVEVDRKEVDDINIQ